MNVFPGWDDYVERLTKNWNAIVSPNDTVVIAGDISWAMKLEEAERDFAYLHSLPGKKLLLKGNHDYWWSTRRKIETFFEEHGFTSLSLVHNSAVAVEGIAVCGTRGWIYNAETPEDQKIVNREVGRLTASLNEAEAFGLRPVVFLHYPPTNILEKTSPFTEIAEEYHAAAVVYSHCHGESRFGDSIRGTYRGIPYMLVSGDYLNFRPALVLP